MVETRTEITRLRRKIAQLEATATKTTSILTGMPRSGNADRDAVLAELADAVAVYREKLVAAEKHELEVMQFVEAIPSPDSRIILRLRYLRGLRWPAVLDELNRHGRDISERQMFRMHGKALQDARKRFRNEE